MSKKMNTQILVEGGIMVALAFVLGEIKLFKLPQGGSVTLGLMIPIIFYSLRHGVGTGVLAGVVLGLLKLANGGYFVSIPQVILDYPVAFGAIGLSGLFSKQFKEQKSIVPVFCGTFVGVLGRFVAAVLSGVIFFAENAKEINMNPWTYSIKYNATYLGIELAIAVVVIFVLRMFITKNLTGDKIGR
ncbi:MAG: energy-coupled thiamine transporter ThiT [Ezakiella sp.]